MYRLKFIFFFLDAIHSSLQAVLVLMITQFMVLDRQSFHMATINCLCTQTCYVVPRFVPYSTIIMLSQHCINT